MEVLKIYGLSKIFGSGRLEVRALEDINLSVAAGDLVALLGPSGSGKTTLLLCISLILEPTAGTVVFDGQTIYQERLDRLRHAPPPPGKDRLHLSSRTTSSPSSPPGKTSSFPQHLVGVKGEAAENRAHGTPGIHGDRRAGPITCPPLLSGGEQQRVAIARALANQPRADPGR